MPSFGPVVLGLLLAGCGSGGPESDAVFPDSVRPGAQRAELRTFAAGEGSEFRYELSIAPCSDDRCAVEVRLLQRGTPVDSASLDWGLQRTPLVRTEPGPLSGIGDPLAGERDLDALVGSLGGEPVSIAAQEIRLGGGERGLLVHQTAGFDHVKRRHYLYVRTGRRLERPWTGIEGAGPHWSAVQVLDSPGDTAEAFLHFRGFRYPNGYPPDDLEVTRFVWSPENDRLLASSPEHLWAAVLGPFPGADSARAIRSNHSGCLGDYWVLPAERFQALSGPGVALAAVTARSSRAARALDQARECVPDVEGTASRFAATSN